MGGYIGGNGGVTQVDGYSKTEVDSKVSDKVEDSQVLTDVPANAVFTDTTYSIQDGELSQNNFTDADHSKLDGIEAGATADQTAAEIKALVGSATDSNVFTDADHTKLDGIETAATADQTKSDIEGLGIDVPATNLTGTIPAARLSTATTQAESDDSTKIATTAYVVDKITTLIGGAPSTLNDLNELAAAINDDANYNSTLTTALATKLPLAGGTMTGNLSFGDGHTLALGDSSEFTIRHTSGGNTNISESGSGNLNISARDLFIQDIAGTNRLKVDGNLGDISFYEDTGTTAKFFWDSSAERLGLGTSSPDVLLHLSSPASSIRFTDTSPATDVYSDIGIDDAGTMYFQADRANTASGTAMIFKLDNAEAMRIDSDGNVGIGATSVVDRKLFVSGGSDTRSDIQLTYNALGNTNVDGVQFGIQTAGAYAWNFENSSLYFGTNNTERMRIDASGNVLVGKTSADFGATVGMEMRSNDTLYVARSGGGALALNRLSSDGDIAEFRKDDSTVGAIGVNSEYLYIHGTRSTDAGLMLGSQVVAPASSTGANRNDAIDLGFNGNSFKDLYLSGSIVNPSGNLTVDVSGEIILDSDAEAIRLRHNGGDIGMFQLTGNNLIIRSMVSDEDMIFKGNDDGSVIDALTLDMSEAGAATFNGKVTTAARKTFASRYQNNNSYGSNFSWDRLQLGNNGTNKIIAGNTSAGGSLLFVVNNSVDLVDATTASGTNGVDAMKIDSSGNVLVGTTDTTPYNNSANSTADNGIALGSSGILSVAKNNDSPIIANRTGSDGGVIKLHKSGVDRGGIGVNTDRIYLGTANRGIAVDESGGTLLPVNGTGTNNDNTLNLGASSVRWKDVHAVSYYGDGSNLTGVGGSTAYGAVGTYIVGRSTSTSTMAAGSTRAGSGIRSMGHSWRNFGGVLSEGTGDNTGAGNLSGTWRIMADTSTGLTSSHYPGGIWVRIS